MTGPTIVAVSGTSRPDNFTSRALALVVDELRKHEDVRVEVLDLRTLALTPPGAQEAAGVADARALVAQASGLVLATPEYHGSYSAAIKLFIENMGFPSVMAGKPIGLLGVAAGQLGAIKAIEHLRAVCSHIGSLVLPGSVSVANVQQMFDGPRVLDEGLDRRIRSVATTMIDYLHGSVCPRVALEEMARSGDTSWMQKVVAALH